MDKYIFEEGMTEISGMGRGYEELCRTMLKAGLEWFDEHPNTNPKFIEYEGICGIIGENNKDAENLSKAVVASVDDCTGAMRHLVISHILWIRKNGWDAYVKEMKSGDQ